MLVSLGFALGMVLSLNQTQFVLLVMHYENILWLHKTTMLSFFFISLDDI